MKERLILVLILVLFNIKINSGNYPIILNSRITNNQNSNLIINIDKYIGLKYIWGSKNIKNKGLDCSGLTYNIFKDNNIIIPFGSYQQVNLGEEIDFKDIQRGDLLFFDFKRSNRINHAAIYIGDSAIFHSVLRGCVIDSLNSSKWNKYKRYLVVVKRIKKGEMSKTPFNVKK